MSALVAFAQVPLSCAPVAAKRQRTRCMADAAILRKYCAQRGFKSYENKLRQVFGLIRAADREGVTKPDLLEQVNRRCAASYRIEWIRLACRHLCWAGLAANGHGLVRYLRPLERTQRKTAIFHRTKTQQKPYAGPSKIKSIKSAVGFAAPSARRVLDGVLDLDIQAIPPTATPARNTPVPKVRQHDGGAGCLYLPPARPLEAPAGAPAAFRVPKGLAGQAGNAWPPAAPAGGAAPLGFTPHAELERMLGITGPPPDVPLAPAPRAVESRLYSQWGHRPPEQLVQGKLLVELAPPTDFQPAKSFQLEIRVCRAKGLGTEHIAAAKRYMVAKRVPLGQSPAGKLMAIAQAIKLGRQQRGEPPLSRYDRADQAARDLAPGFYARHSVGGMQWLF